MGLEGGRLHSTVWHSTRKNKRLLMQGFQNLDALNGVVGEILSAATLGACASPKPLPQLVVILSTYRDNIYIALVAVSPCYEAPLTFLIEQLTTVIYGIPMKWEPHARSPHGVRLH